MSAQEQMRAMLDQLMGTGRDGENNRYKVTFEDPRVCKSFLMKCCPHDILASTRMDLGECPKIHDLALRADFEAASSKKDYYYDIDAMEHLQSFIGDCDRRTELAKKRLKETQEELSEEANAKVDMIHILGEEIGTKLAKAEELGAEGNVEESMKLMEEVEELKKRKGQAEMEYRNTMPVSSYQQQKLRVCEVCSAYLGIHDNDQRLADHFGGKLHLGFITIRNALDELKKSVAERREKREKEREARRLEREAELAARRSRSRSASRSKRKSRSRSRSHRRSRSRDKRRRSRSRSRDRRRSRRSRSRSRSRRHRRDSRSRSRDRRRRRRSRSRSHHSRSRSHRSKHSRRSRSRSRSRSRRSRSRSRSKRSRSHTKRSNSRSRSRSKERESKERETPASVENGESGREVEDTPNEDD